MARFQIRQAVPSDNDSLQLLARVPMAGSISIAMEREPDYFASSSVQNDSPHVAVVCDSRGNNRIIGVISLGTRRVYIDGTETRVRYLSDVRILPQYRGLRPLRVINDYIRDCEMSDRSRTMHSIIFRDNTLYRGIIDRPPDLVRRLKYLWYYESGEFRTSAISLQAGSRTHTPRYQIRRGVADDVDQMQRFFDAEAPAKQFYPAYRFAEIGKDYFKGLEIGDYFLAFEHGRLVGITGTWDQSAFKQTRVAGYSGWLKRFRIPLNILSPITTGFSLPPPGSEIRCFYLHTILTADNRADVFTDILEHIYAEYLKGSFAYFLVGLFTHDPLIDSVNRFRNRRDMIGCHYEVGADELEMRVSSDAPMYLEAARI